MTRRLFVTLVPESYLAGFTDTHFTQPTTCTHTHSNQRRATKKEARELDVEIESRLSDARTTLQIQVSSN